MRKYGMQMSPANSGHILIVAASVIETCLIVATVFKPIKYSKTNPFVWHIVLLHDCFNRIVYLMNNVFYTNQLECWLLSEIFLLIQACGSVTN